MLKKINHIKYSVFVLVLTISFLTGILISTRNKSEKIYSKSKFYLGSIVDVKFYSNDESLAERALDEVFKEFERIDKKYSFYSTRSYLSKLNSNEGTKIQVDDETFYLLKLCDSVYKLTNGKFDVAIGSLTNLWKRYIDRENQIELQNLKVNLVESSSKIPQKFLMNTISLFLKIILVGRISGLLATMK